MSTNSPKAANARLTAELTAIHEVETPLAELPLTREDGTPSALSVFQASSLRFPVRADVFVFTEVTATALRQMAVNMLYVASSPSAGLDGTLFDDGYMSGQYSLSHFGGLLRGSLDTYIDYEQDLIGAVDGEERFGNVFGAALIELRLVAHSPEAKAEVISFAEAVLAAVGP